MTQDKEKNLQVSIDVIACNLPSRDGSTKAQRSFSQKFEPLGEHEHIKSAVGKHIIVPSLVNRRRCSDRVCTSSKICLPHKTSASPQRAASLAESDRLLAYHPFRPARSQLSMRSCTSRTPNCYNIAPDSPPTTAVWSTERRLIGKPPPGAPRKSGRRSSLPSSARTLECNLTPTKRQRVGCLLLPSRRIHDDDDDDDDSPSVSLNFRPTRLFFDDDDSVGIDGQKDPTTVLLIPDSQTQVHWLDEDDSDDTALSTRLFRFGPAFLSRFEAIDVAEDISDDIFRQSDEPEERECAEDESPRQCLSAELLERSRDDDGDGDGDDGGGDDDRT